MEDVTELDRRFGQNRILAGSLRSKLRPDADKVLFPCDEPVKPHVHNDLDVEGAFLKRQEDLASPTIFNHGPDHGQF